MSAMTEAIGMLLGLDRPRKRAPAPPPDDGLTTKTIATSPDGVQSLVAICQDGKAVAHVDVGHISALIKK